MNYLDSFHGIPKRSPNSMEGDGPGIQTQNKCTDEWCLFISVAVTTQLILNFVDQWPLQGHTFIVEKWSQCILRDSCL